MEIEYPATLYADTRTDAIAMFRSLTEAEAATIVPLNPEWSVTDVAAHVCGIVDDVLHGNVEGLGTDEWTQAQVDKRTETSLSDICDEWQSYNEQIDARTAADPFFGVRITGDLIIHVHDVHHALNRTIRDTGDVATKLAAHRYVPPLQERAIEQLGLGITVDLTDGRAYPAGQAIDTIALRCSSYDFLRAVTGRRSRRQVEALGWDRDPANLLDTAWNTYGPLRTDDVSI